MANKNEKVGHTPGPWTASGPLGPTRDRDPGNAPQWVMAEHTVHIYVQPCSDGFVPGQNAANARLIAAAPELLAALETALGMLEGLNMEDGGPEPEMDEMRAAIAKAKGG